MESAIAAALLTTPMQPAPTIGGMTGPSESDNLALSGYCWSTSTQLVKPTVAPDAWWGRLSNARR
ncbi:MAG: hypothetical protein KA144_05080 [Xanthomonadaceae bacterium]|nr:hypothetical protein [Xanthomonadaceae bacterium]